MRGERKEVLVMENNAELEGCRMLLALVVKGESICMGELEWLETCGLPASSFISFGEEINPRFRLLQEETLAKLSGLGLMTSMESGERVSEF